jgi:hypothetical protein
MYETFRIQDAAGVSKYRAVVQGTLAGDIAKPAGAHVAKFVGITQEDQATQWKGVRVKTCGRTFAVASNATAVGDYVGIADNTGKVVSNHAAAIAAPGEAANVFVIGVARTAAQADGDIIEIDIQPFMVKTAAS